MLCGMIGALLAQEPTNPLGAAAVGVEWHGRAADAWARDRGQTATHTTELLNYLGTVLRDPTLP